MNLNVVRRLALLLLIALVAVPSYGRFLSEDSWEGEQQTAPSLHKYLYAYQNPTAYVDPTGNEPLGLNSRLDQRVKRLQNEEISREEFHNEIKSEGLAGLSATAALPLGVEAAVIAGSVRAAGWRGLLTYEAQASSLILAEEAATLATGATLAPRVLPSSSRTATTSRSPNVVPHAQAPKPYGNNVSLVTENSRGASPSVTGLSGSMRANPAFDANTNHWRTPVNGQLANAQSRGGRSVLEQIHGGRFNVEVGPGYSTGTGVKPNAHNANARLLDNDGNTLNVWREVSGEATASQKSLGSALMRQATHTEQKGLTRVQLEDGQTLRFTGQQAPCKNCQGAMRSSTLDNSGRIEYQWLDEIDGKTVIQREAWEGGKKVLKRKK